MIKIFKYIPDVGCFIVAPLYKELADKLGLTEWNEVVWIGRYFFLDDDVGEHWFDNGRSGTHCVKRPSNMVLNTMIFWH